MPKPRDAGVYETPMPDDFKIVGDDWAPLGGGSIPFAGHDKNFVPGSNPDNPQEVAEQFPSVMKLPPLTDVMYHACRGMEYEFSMGGPDSVTGYVDDDMLDAIWEQINTALRCAQVPAAMPAACPTPYGCRPNGCHGACLPQSEPTKQDMRKNFEEWARDAAGLDMTYAHSDSPLDRRRYERSDTAVAWEAWSAATTTERERCSDPLPAATVQKIKKACDSLGLDAVGFAWRVQKAVCAMAHGHTRAATSNEFRVRDPWVDKDGQWWAVADDNCTYPKCDCDQPEDAGCGRK